MFNQDSGDNSLLDVDNAALLTQMIVDGRLSAERVTQSYIARFVCQKLPHRISFAMEVEASVNRFIHQSDRSTSSGIASSSFSHSYYLAC